MTEREVTEEAIGVLHKTLVQQAAAAGYHLNPDEEFTRSLLRGLLVNEGRYGYGACPCRLASGSVDEDRDIVCPCDYRDADVSEFGACYCALYVSEAVARGETQVGSIPERRPPSGKRQARAEMTGGTLQSLRLPVWRCSVCGYLCAREQPPDVCPICKVRRDRFERFV